MKSSAKAIFYSERDKQGMTKANIAKGKTSKLSPKKRDKLTIATEISGEGNSEKVEKILKGAIQEFLVHGYAATSMDRVAAAAGVSKATVYSHFQDKESLFVAIVEQLAQKQLNLLGNKPPQGEPPEVLRKIATVWLDRAINEKNFQTFIRLIIGESGRFPNLAQIFVRHVAKPGIEKLRDYLAAQPQLKIADPEATALIFIGSLVHYLLLQEVLQGKEIVPMESDRLIDTLVRSIVCSKVENGE